MQVVVPLRVEQPPAQFGSVPQEGGTVVIVLEHKMNVAADGGPHGTGELDQKMSLARIHDRVHGIEAQSVKPKLLEPVESIGDVERTHLGPAKADRLPPRCPEIRSKEFGCIAAESVSRRAEVIVNDIEEYHQAVTMGGVHQGLELVRRAVAPVRGEGENAVVAPVSPARKIG